MTIEGLLISQLREQGIDLSERLGQHFLVDEGVIDQLSAAVITGAKVIEVGSGIGHITNVLAKRAGSVIGIEIDRRFQPVLEDIQNRDPRIEFMFKDALQVPFGSLIDRGEEAQIVANLPFHITEPFMYKLINLPIASAVLMFGVRVAREFQEPETSLGFGKMALLSQTFFDTRILAQVPREAFYPQPRTDAVIMEFDPKDRKELEANPVNYVFAYLFRRAKKFGLVMNDMKQALVEASQQSINSDLSKRESHRKDRSSVRRALKQILGEYNGSRDMAIFQNHKGIKNRVIISQSQAIDVIGRMGIPQQVLSKPFFRLDNQDIRHLAVAVREFYLG